MSVVQLGSVLSFLSDATLTDDRVQSKLGSLADDFFSRIIFTDVQESIDRV